MPWSGGLVASAFLPTLLELALGAPWLLMADFRGLAVVTFAIPFSAFMTLLGMRAGAKLMLARASRRQTLSTRLAPLVAIVGPVMAILILPAIIEPLGLMSPVAFFTQLLGDVRCPFGGACIGAAAEHRIGISIPRMAPGIWMVLLVYLLAVAVLGWMDFGAPVNNTLCTLGFKHADSGYLGPTFLERQDGIPHQQAVEIVAHSHGDNGAIEHDVCVPGVLSYAIAGSLLILFLGGKMHRKPNSD
ncbi:MAG: hypothetical protein ACYCW6_05100 [Candidatus Xenobia bacterium]